MNADLDGLLGKLRDEPIDRPLGALESDVWRRIDLRRRSSAGFRQIAALRAAVLSAAMIGGVAAGSAITADAGSTRAGEISVFELQPHLAPSTLLEGNS